MTHDRQTLLCSFALLLFPTLEVSGVIIQNTGTIHEPKATTMHDIADEEWDTPYDPPVQLRNHDSSMFIKQSTDTIAMRLSPKSQHIISTLRQERDWDARTIEKMEVLFFEYKNKGVYFEVGTNIGAYLLPMAEYLMRDSHAHVPVVAVEGNPWLVSNVRAGLRFNDLRNTRLYQYAVGSPEEAEKGAIDELQRLKQPVPVTTIDTLAKKANITGNVLLMKMDLDGHELEALKGATEFFKQGPCYIMITKEYAPYMKDLGYQLESGKGNEMDVFGWRPDLRECIKNLDNNGWKGWLKNEITWDRDPVTQ